MNPKYPTVAARAEHICEYCKAPEILSNMAFEIDHIIPISRNGTEDVDNLALACRVCNLRKSDHINGMDSNTQQYVRLFHPRQDSWTDHFEKSSQLPYTILDKTAIGRATISRLNLNSSLQLRAREYWVVLGVFSLT